MIDNAVTIVAIELLAAAQGIEFHRPQTSSEILEEVVGLMREVSPAFEEDRSLSADFRRVGRLIDDGRFCRYAESILPSFST